MKAIYDSGLHHPLAAYVAAAVLFALLWRNVATASELLRGRPFLLAFLALFGVEIVLDATVTGAWSPVSGDSALYQPLSILFVILGDLRYFVLAERHTRPGVGLGRVLAVTVPLSLLVPITTGLGSKLIPAMGDARVLFLVYELMLLVLVANLQHLVYGSRAGVGSEGARFVRRLSGFVMVQYAGWAAADIAILSGVEAGHLLRVVPNVLYYAGFLLYVFLVAPERELSP